MSNGAESERLVYLIGPARTIEVIVRSESGPELGSAEVRRGESRFPRETFAGAYPEDEVIKNTVWRASTGS